MLHGGFEQFFFESALRAMLQAFSPGCSRQSMYLRVMGHSFSGGDPVGDRHGWIHLAVRPCVAQADRTGAALQN